MPTTSHYGIRYFTLDDIPDGASQLGTEATDVDAALFAVDTRLTDEIDQTYLDAVNTANAHSDLLNSNQTNDLNSRFAAAFSDRSSANTSDTFAVDTFATLVSVAVAAPPGLYISGFQCVSSAGVASSGYLRVSRQITGGPEIFMGDIPADLQAGGREVQIAQYPFVHSGGTLTIRGFRFIHLGNPTVYTVGTKLWIYRVA